jgi:NAD(P)-dependent dehydrogenase (short-subunit alcohol dehydrogenase family)
MKTLSATAKAIVAIILICAFSTGGQQQSEKGQQQSPGFTPVARQRKPPTKPSDWRMPDGRVVEFPASMSKDEIDALAKRIAEGAVELPPGARVIGWEPVEDANSLLPQYAERVATIPTVKGKLDALANGAGMLQTQIDSMKADIKYAHDLIAIQHKRDDELTKVVNANADATTNNAAVLADNVSSLTMKTNELDDLKRELDTFKEAACPVLRTARMGEVARMKVDSACGLH